MKKSLSVLLGLTIVASSFANLASAADVAAPTTAEKYKWFVDAGILKGTPDGDAHAADKLTRAEFATIATAVAGLPVSTSGQTFSDVTKGQWYFGAIEAAAKAGLVNGSGAGKFSPKANVTVESIIKVAVAIAGLKTVAGTTVAGASDWAAPSVKAALDAGLIKSQADYRGQATRGDVIDIAFAVANLTSKPVLSDVKAVLNAGDTVTVTGKVAGKSDSVKVKVGTAAEVAATLNADGTFTYTTKKLAAGKYDIVVTGYNGKVASAASTANVEVKAFAVTAVTVLNATQVKVDFNKEVDNTASPAATSAATAANYTKNGGAIGATAAVASDKLSVTLTFAGTQNNTSFTLGLANIKTADGSETISYSGTVTVIDTAAPVVSKTEFLPNGDFKITFSEPLSAVNPIVRINGLPVAAVAVAANAEITIAKATLDAAGISVAGGATATVYIAGAKDIPGTEMALYNGSVTKGTDTVKPSVVSVTQNGQETVRVVFSEDVTGLVAGEVKFLKGVAVVNSTAVAAGPDAKTYDVTFTGAVYGVGETSAAVTVLLAADQVADGYANGNVAFSQAFTFTSDKTAPTFVSATANAAKTLVNVTFNEAIGTTVPAKFIVTDANGVRFTVATATITADTKVVALDFGAIADGTYTIAIQAGAVKDVQANDIVATSTTVVVGSAVDATKPVLSLFSTAGNVFKVNSTIELGASALDVANYKLDGAALPAGTVTYFTGAAKTQVAIELPAGSVNIGAVAGGTGAVLNATNVASKNGVKADSTNLGVTIRDNTSATLQTAQKVGNVLILTFNENLDATTFNALTEADVLNSFEIKADGTAITVGGSFDVTVSAVAGAANKIQINIIDAGTSGYAASKAITVATKGVGVTDANGFTVAAGTAVAAN